MYKETTAWGLLSYQNTRKPNLWQFPLIIWTFQLLAHGPKISPITSWQSIIASPIKSAWRFPCKKICVDYATGFTHCAVTYCFASPSTYLISIHPSTPIPFPFSGNNSSFCYDQNAPPHQAPSPQPPTPLSPGPIIPQKWPIWESHQPCTHHTTTLVNTYNPLLWIISVPLRLWLPKPNDRFLSIDSATIIASLSIFWKNLTKLLFILLHHSPSIQFTLTYAFGTHLPTSQMTKKLQYQTLIQPFHPSSRP